MIGLYELLGNPTTYLIEPPGPFPSKEGGLLYQMSHMTGPLIPDENSGEIN